MPEVLRERHAVARAQRDRDAELLEILREGLAAEVDLSRPDKRVDVPLELGRGEGDDTFGQAPEAVLGKNLVTKTWAPEPASNWSTCAWCASSSAQKAVSWSSGISATICARARRAQAAA